LIQNITYRSAIQGAIIFIILAFSFLLSGYKWILPILVVVWFLFIILEFNFTKRYKESVNKHTYKLLLLQLFFYFIIVLGYFYSTNKLESANDNIRKLGLLAFPLLFMFTGNLLNFKKHLVLKLFILSNIFFSFVCLGNALFNSVEITSMGLTIDTNGVTGNLFYYSNLSFLQHPAYFSMYIVFSLASMFYLKDENKFKKSRFNLIIYYAVFLFFLVMVYLLSSRAGIISAIILSAFRLVQNVFRYKSNLYKVAAISIFVFAITLVLRNPRVQNKLLEAKQLTLNTSGTKAMPVRIVFWTTAIDVINNYFWFGTGNGDLQDVFDKKYMDNEFAQKKFLGYNAHNEFLQVFMSSGVIGFTIFLMIFIFSIEKALKEKNQLFLIFLALIFLNLLFESMLNTLAGLFFISFFLNYFIFNNEVEIIDNE